jgi:ubiquitin-conjugating enzyme E2 A
MSDLKTMKQNPPEGVSASPMSDENLYVWGGTVFGPDDTAWEGGIYSMRLTFTEQYPDKPPRVRFTSEMVRPIPPAPLAWPMLPLPSASRWAVPVIAGDSCLWPARMQGNASHMPPSFPLSHSPPTRRPQFHPNIYPDGTLCMDLIQDNWSPIYSVCSILIAIRSLLTDPNCASPANPEAAHLYQTDKKQYGRRVRRVAEKSVGG